MGRRFTGEPPKLRAGVHVLGPLCRREHEYEDTGLTLRYKRNWACPVCERIAKREKRLERAARSERPPKSPYLYPPPGTLGDVDGLRDSYRRVITEMKRYG